MNATEIENRINTTIPPEVLEALSRVRGQFSPIEHVFHCIQVDIGKWVGVAGDGDNGDYEHFVFKDGKLTISDRGYGDTAFALLEVLKQENV